MWRIIVWRVACFLTGHEWVSQREWDAPSYCLRCGKERRDE